MRNMLSRWLPIFTLLLMLILFFYFHLYRYLSFESLQYHRQQLLTWTEQHYLLMVIGFIFTYVVVVAISVPGAVFLTLAGGFLFGIVAGTTYVVIGATIGAILLFLAIRSALGVWLSKRASGWIALMETGFKENAFNYLLTLRLIPLFPFWLVNIVPALLNISLRTFALATFLGIIPGSFVYVLVGNGLGHVFDANESPKLDIIFDPKIFIPLLALAFLSLVPVGYKYFKRRQKLTTQEETMKQSIQCDIAIIGGGAGGLSLAAGASQLGAKVVLVESGKMGGDCLNYGCVPSKSLLSAAKAFYQVKSSQYFGVQITSMTLDFAKVMQHVHEVIATIAKNDSVERFESLGVRVIQAHAKFIDTKTVEAGDVTIRAKRFVIATGSSAFVPPIPGLDKVPYETNESIFNIKEQPEHLIVIGGGPIGCELAQAFAMLGTKVTLLEVFNILPKDDVDCVAIVREQLEKMQIAIYERIKVQQITKEIEGGITVSIEKEGATQVIQGSHLLVATGRRANVQGLDLDNANVAYSPKGIEVDAHLKSSNKNVYAIGDVAGSFQFTHIANYHAGIVLRNILFRMRAKVDYRAVPWVTYTEPEMAHVGITAEEAKEHPNSQVVEWSFQENDRAQAEHKTVGKIKVITDRKARILGVTIVGPHSGELILPWIIAIRQKQTLRNFTDTIVPYPTLSEISKRAASEFYIPRLFSDKTRWLIRMLLKLG